MTNATSTRPIVFLDTETTGLHHDRRPWEIAMIRREPDGLETEHLLQVSDVDLTTAELKGLQIGGFYERWYGARPRCDRSEEELANDPTKVDREFLVAHTVERVTRGAVIIGAVPNFDTETLAAMLRRHNLCSSWHYQLVDIEPLAVGWLRGMNAEANLIGFPLPRATEFDLAPPWSSDDLSRACGVTPPTEEERHTALGDARWVRRWFDHLRGEVA